MWVTRTGAPWRALPKEYGKWSTVHKRFMEWAKAGVWQMIFNTLAVDADNEWNMIDSTIIRAHQHSAGAIKEYRNWCARTRATCLAPENYGVYYEDSDSWRKRLWDRYYTQMPEATRREIRLFIVKRA